MNASGEPWAELWMGAHPKAPSQVRRDDALFDLDLLIQTAPEAYLGAEAVERFGPQLPYLFKVLAAAAPLSIQCHPDLDQAREGFSRENEAHVPIDAPHRNYRDANHKPELIVALSRFVALKGFRPLSEVRADLRALGLTEGPLWAAAEAPEAEGLRGLLKALLTSDPEPRAEILRKLKATTPPKGQRFAWVSRLLEAHPGDLSVLCPLILNLVELQPGEGLFLPARELHAYLEGTGLELMASSDNVLRGGLTIKHVDVPELMSVLSFAPTRPQILRAEPRAGGLPRFNTPAEEFSLSLLRLEQGARTHRVKGPEILLCLEGKLCAETAQSRQALDPGVSVFVSASAGSLKLSGQGLLAVAALP